MRGAQEKSRIPDPLARFTHWEPITREKSTRSRDNWCLLLRVTRSIPCLGDNGRSPAFLSISAWSGAQPGELEGSSNRPWLGHRLCPQWVFVDLLNKCFFACRGILGPFPAILKGCVLSFCLSSLVSWSLWEHVYGVLCGHCLKAEFSNFLEFSGFCFAWGGYFSLSAVLLLCCLFLK